MKEITTEITLKVMWHEKVEDHDVDGYISSENDPETQRKFAEAVSAVLGADKVDVVGKVKMFIMDDVKKDEEVAE